MPPPSRSAELPREVRIEQQRRNVLDAATEVFAKRGYPVTTTDHIVRRRVRLPGPPDQASDSTAARRRDGSTAGKRNSSSSMPSKSSRSFAAST